MILLLMTAAALPFLHFYNIPLAIVDRMNKMSCTTQSRCLQFLFRPFVSISFSISLSRSCVFHPNTHTLYCSWSIYNQHSTISFSPDGIAKLSRTELAVHESNWFCRSGLKKKTIAAIALHYIWSRRGIDFRLCFSCLHPANSLDSCTCIKRAECTGLVWPERRNAIISMIYDSQCSLYFKRLFFPCPLLGVLDS